MKWIGKQISYNDEHSKTTIIVTPNTPTFIKALMGAWYFMWFTIGLIVIWAYFAMKLKKEEELILLVFLVFWAYYVVRIGRAFLWIMFGTEYLKIDKISMTIKPSIKHYGKAKEYYLENIKKIRLTIPKERSLQASWENSPWVRGGERIEFDYQGKLIRFGRKLDPQDAKLLFQVITKRIEDQLKRKKD